MNRTLVDIFLRAFPKVIKVVAESARKSLKELPAERVGTKKPQQKALPKPKPKENQTILEIVLLWRMGDTTEKEILSTIDSFYKSVDLPFFNAYEPDIFRCGSTNDFHFTIAFELLVDADRKTGIAEMEKKIEELSKASTDFIGYSIK